MFYCIEEEVGRYVNCCHSNHSAPLLAFRLVSLLSFPGFHFKESPSAVGNLCRVRFTLT